VCKFVGALCKSSYRTVCVIQCPRHGGERNGRHFQLKYHYQRECVEAGHVIFTQVGTKDNTADLMTKPVELVDFRRLAPKLKGMAPL